MSGLNNKDFEDLQIEVLALMSVAAIFTKVILNLKENGMKVINKNQEDFLIDSLLLFEAYMNKVRKEAKTE